MGTDGVRLEILHILDWYLVVYAKIAAMKKAR